MATETALDKPTAGEVERTEHTRSVRHYRPNVDILETAEELTVLADMPGTSPEDIDIDFEKGTLTIHGKVRPRQPDNTQFLLQEYGLGDFYRTFQVSETVDAGRIAADYKDGVLVLHLPKT
jgi:HSP20 family molecular chaperone IbpA